MFLSVSNLTKSYNTGIITHVLKGVDLEMERGQTGVILGPSGSGKSTLVNIIGGVDRADSGTVEVGSGSAHWIVNTVPSSVLRSMDCQFSKGTSSNWIIAAGIWNNCEGGVENLWSLLRALVLQRTGP
jgi:ABC-type polar amino acid transport system ATPase subunit